MGRKGSGVEVRGRDYRIRFTWNGRRYAEPVPLKPSVPNTKHVKRIAAEVQRALAEGTFTFVRFFPDSEHAEHAPEATFGAMAHLWIKSRGAPLSNWQRKKDVLHSKFWRAKIGEAKPMRLLMPSALEALVGSHPWPSAKHRNNVLTALRGICDLWVRDAPRDRVSPAAGIRNGKVQKQLPDPFEVKEAEIIIGDMAEHYDPRIGAYYETAFFSGLRPEEQIALRWDRLDDRTRTGKIDRARTACEEKETKNHVARIVHFNPRAWAAIQRMRPFTFLKPHGHVFENPRTGNAWASEADQRDLYWTPTLRRLRLRHRRAYQTRSTCATMYLMMGRKPGWICRELGHSERVFWESYAVWIARVDRGPELDTFEDDLAKLKNARLA